MSEKQNPSEVNDYISNAALNKEPIFKAYKRLCSIYGEMDYVDYEWRYYQFLHGNCDISIEKSPENSSSVSFTDLPIDVLKKVMGKLDMINCLVVRKVSHDLRNMVDDSKLKCKDVILFFDRDKCELHLDNWVVTYDSTNGQNVGLSKKASRDSSYIEHVKWRKFNYPVNVFERMIDDATTILKNSKLEIDYFEVQTKDREVPLQLVTFLESLNFQIHAKELNLSLESNTNPLIPILKSITPKTLKKIRFVYGLEMDKMNEIMEMEQWKKAEIFDWKYIPYGFPIEKLFRFKQFSVEELLYLSEELLINIRDTLLKLPHFESCILAVLVSEPEYDEDEDEVGIQFDFIDGIMSQDPAYNSETHRYLIPNSREYFEFDIYLPFGRRYYIESRLECLEIKRTSLDN